MKKLLVGFLIILPILFLTIQSVTGLNEVKLSQNNIPTKTQLYNEEIIKYFEQSIINSDFSGGEKYFDDEIIVYSYSLEKFSTMFDKDMIELLNDMLENSVGHSYEIYHHKDDDGNNIYTMKYFYIRGEKETKESITFYFTEISGTISKVYGP
jgi:hypothetical protein